VLGVLNLRGSIVPIVDLRMRFNLERAEYTALTVIIVLSIESSLGRRDFGLVVDGVSDVIDVPSGDVKPAPDLGGQASTEFIEGLAAVSGRMVMLLDIDKLIGGDVTGVAPLPAAANA
jgi:purine-binding chemotaxis protein CheW